MVLSCSSYNCTNRFSKGCGISFHRFPLKNEEMCKKWVLATKRKNFIPTKNSAICSLHFVKDDFLPRINAYVCGLKPEAVPSKFDFPEHLMPPAIKTRRLIIKKIDVLPTNNSSKTVQVIEEPVDVPPANGKKDQSTQTDNSPPVELKCLRRKVKLLQQRLLRREKRLTTLDDLIKRLKGKGHSSDKLEEALKEFEGFPLDFLVHMKKNNKTCKNGYRYNPNMKNFALTLFFYSPKAYNYVRSLFILPHVSNIRKWVSSVNCEPGFLEEVFDFLSLNSNLKSEFKDCILMLDGMSIRKEVVWDQATKKLAGYVDLGGIHTEKNALASEVIVFMIVSVKKNFKCPIAYFLTNGLDSTIQAQLLNTAMTKLDDIGVRVWGITCDGSQANIGSLRILGCQINTKNKYFEGCFEHPSKKYKVYGILDVCHMMKLARNALAEVKSFESPKGIIKWEYIEKLCVIQKKEGFSFANKLSGAHVNYKNKKMNVKLAAQTLSSSVADAIEFLDRSGNPEFAHSEATVEFIRFLDRIFDILNSRNPFAKGYKSPLRSNNKHFWLKIFEDTESYIQSLNIGGTSLLSHRRNTFAFGLILSMNSIKKIALEILERDDSPLDYLLTYKMSQDHLELFFSCIRSRGGWNDNPNVCQIKYAMKKLLLGNSVKSFNSNCTNFEQSSLTPIYEFRCTKRSLQLELNDNDDPILELELVKYSNMLQNMNELSNLQGNILYYIAGYICRQLMGKIHCKDCISILHPHKSTNDHTYANFFPDHTMFTKFVSRGKIIETSEIVYRIVEFTEKCFKLLVVNGDKMQSNILKKISHCVVGHFSDKRYMFPQLSHDLEAEFHGGEDLHETQIIRKNSEKFALLRLKTYARRFSQENVNNNKASVRQKLHKLILFNNV